MSRLIDKPGVMGDLCTLLAWDSEHWGFPVARVNGNNLTADTTQEAIRWCEGNGVRCLYFAADGTCAETLRAAWCSGFHFVDARVDMEARSAESVPHAASGFRCREADRGDLSSLEQLARVAHEDTRFFKDTAFDRARAADLYALWIARDFREHKVFVVASNDVPQKLLGYVSAECPDGHTGRIGLLAVMSEARSRGLGQLLVQHALAWCKSRGIENARVATQATNIPALRLYEGCGFKVADVKLWFHLWFNN